MEFARRAFLLWIAAALPSLAREAVGRGDHDLAVNYLQTYLVADPGSTDAHVLLGWAYFKKGDQDRAVRAYGEAIRLDPERARTYAGRGCAYGASARYDRAMDDFCEAIRLDPNNAQFYLERARCHAAREETASGLRDCDRALRLAPKNVEAYRLRAHLFGESKMFARSVADYRSLLSLDPDDAPARLALLDLLSTAPDEAVRNLPHADEVAGRLDAGASGSHRAYLTLAAAHARRGELDRAIAWQRKALDSADHLDKEDRKRARLVLRWYRERKRQADEASSRRAPRTAPRPCDP
jgi:tetratricopeptide (TPR) repeat protein